VIIEKEKRGYEMRIGREEERGNEVERTAGWWRGERDKCGFECEGRRNDRFFVDVCIRKRRIGLFVRPLEFKPIITQHPF
jgi:hypothetical protein